MLFKYSFVNDDAGKLHELAKHIVLDVWCKAQGKIFTRNKITEDNGFRAKVFAAPENLKKPIHNIYKLCAKFNSIELDYIKDAFEKNNQIQELCENSVSPVFYDDLKDNTSEEFAINIKIFFNGLYKEVFKQKPFYINKHYDKFFVHNKPLCPFCGLTTLEKDSSNYRDDYDHYLPKDKYPFNAVNLENLLPMCSDCNKKWKRTNNPIRDGLNIKKAFYYFGDIEPDYKIEMNILNSDLTDFDVSISLSSLLMPEKVDSWNRLFSLSGRYRDDFVCHNDFGIAWIRSISAKKLKAQSLGKPYDVEIELWGLEDNLIADKNFLRIPLFNSCKEEGII